MSDAGLTRRGFLRLAGAGAALGGLVSAGVAFADPQSADAQWIAHHVETRLMGADGQPVVGLPAWTRMRVVREDGDVWQRATLVDSKAEADLPLGYIHHSLVRLPRLPFATVNPDRQDAPGRHFEADLKDPAMLTAFEDGVPIWSTLTLKG